MAEFPALTLWTDAYLSDTRHLSTLEHGAYLLLLMEAWRRPNCDLPDDDKILSRLAGLSLPEWGEVKDAVMAFWKRDGRSKTWTQKRLLNERDKARVRSRSQSDKATKRWKNTKKDDAAAMPVECPEDASTATAIAHREEEPIGPSSQNASKSSDGLFANDALPVAPKRGAKPKRSVGVDTPLPEDWEPTLTPAAQAMVDGWPPGALDREEFQFRNHAIANGRKAKDWDAAFRMWIGKADERHGNRSGYGNSGRGTFAGDRQPRPRTDGFTDAINDALARGGSGFASGPSGRWDDDHAAGDQGLRPARARVIR